METGVARNCGRTVLGGRCAGGYEDARVWGGVDGASRRFERAAPCTVHEEEPSNELLQVHVQEELELLRVCAAPGCTASDALRRAGVRDRQWAVETPTCVRRGGRT